MRKKEKPQKDDKKSLMTLKHALKTIVWPRRKLLLLGLVLIIINRVAGMALPASTKFLIDDVIAKGDTSLLKELIRLIVLLFSFCLLSIL